MDEVKCEVARNLARQLDDAQDARSGAVLQSVPAMSKQLVLLMQQIASEQEEEDTFLRDLFWNDNLQVDMRVWRKQRQAATAAKEVIGE